MPELPEVETIARGLAERLPGRLLQGATVKHADVLAPPLTAADLDRRLAGRRIERVGRHGKNVLFTLAFGAPRGAGRPPQSTPREAERTDEPLRMLVNLGMTGRLVLAGMPAASSLGHVAVRFRMEEGDLLYDDVRRFGRIELHEPASWAERIRTIGIDPMTDAFATEALHDLTSRSRTPIRTWLLDQRHVAGIGNIYASEALFRARVHPGVPARSLTQEDAGRLRHAIQEVLAEAIDARGTTFSDYRDATGEAGDFAMRLRVYDREGEPCLACGASIERAVITNRSAFFCPVCQQRPHRRRRRR